MKFEEGSLVTGINDGTFSGCINLESISIPANVRYLGKGCFWGCEKLKNVYFEEDSRLVNWNFRLLEIRNFAFGECRSLTFINILPRVLYLPKGCFWKCENLENVNFKVNSELVRINSQAFSGCRSLMYIGFRTPMARILGGCFSGCKSLQAVRPPIGGRLGNLFEDNCFDSYVDVVYFRRNVCCLFNPGRGMNIFAAVGPSAMTVPGETEEFLTNHFPCESGGSKPIFIPIGVKISGDSTWDFTDIPGNHTRMFKIEENEVEAF